MKKETAIVLGTTKNSAFAIANVIIGLERYSSPFIDSYFVYHDGLTRRDQQALQKLSPKVRLESYTAQDFFQKLGLQETYTQALERYTHMTCVHYEMFQLLESYRNVIWIDFDILIQKDISQIVDFGPMAMLRGGTQMKDALGQETKKCPSDLVCKSPGVFIITDDLPNYPTWTEELYQTTRDHLATLTLPDLAVINLVAYRRGILIKELPDFYGCPPEWLKAKNCGVVHTAGMYRRLWNHQSIRIAFPEWELNNKLWEKTGGQPFEGEIYNPDHTPDSGGAFVQYFRHTRHFNNINLEICPSFQLQIVSQVGEKQIQIESIHHSKESFSALVTIASKTIITVELMLSCATFDWETEEETTTLNGVTYSQDMVEDGLCRLSTKATDATVISCLSAALTSEPFRSVLLTPPR